jgi:hypothetical protein
MEIRSAQVTDLAVIDALYHEGLQLALQGEGATQPVRLWHIVSRTLSSLLPLATPSEMLFVLEERGRVMGFIQGEILTAGDSRVRQRPAAVRVLNLSLATTLSSSAGGALIDHLCNAALQQGAARIYVRLPVDHPATESFRAHLFRPYARDRVFYRDDLAGLHPGPADAGLRAARRRDLGAIFNLYLAATPRAVSQLEAPDFAQWQALHESEWNAGLSRGPGRGWLLERAEVLAWLGLQPGAPGRPHTIALMVRSDAGADGDVQQRLLGEAVRRLARHPAAAWCNVRNYDTTTTRVLQEAGFAGLTGQELLVRDLRSPAAVPVRKQKKEKAFTPAFG